MEHLLFNFYYKGIVVDQILDLIADKGKHPVSDPRTDRASGPGGDE
ncbi:hypothetical protein [Methanosphaerula palustris]|nr:hypothetical protein [Methanosphaerula palustris]